MKGSSLLTVFMNLLLVVATRSRAAAWIFSPSARQIRTTCSSPVIRAQRPSSCHQSRHNIHDGAYFFLLQGSLSSSSSPLAVAARRNGWCFQTNTIQNSERSRPGSIIALCCAKMMSTGFDGSSMNKKKKKNSRDDDDDGQGNIEDDDNSTFTRGDKILVEVISFGPMGASVEVIGTSHDPKDMIDESQPALAKGLILQREIHYFRQARGNIDVVRGEVLPAYVERVRQISSTAAGDGEYRLDICLRSFGGKAKAQQVSDLILQRLQDSRDGRLEVGDKSTPDEILEVFPGISKTTFKTAVSHLYKLGKVQQPQPYSISLMQQQQQQEK